ncbi:MAG: hypothetical protein QM805_00005, partial [Pseudomonas sp.]
KSSTYRDSKLGVVVRQVIHLLLFTSCFGGSLKKKIAEVVDSEFDRCRMRLPLMRRFPSLKPKRLSRKEIFEK